MSNQQAQDKALALRDSFEFEPTSLVTYQSAGRMIVVGDDDALKRCADLPANLGFEPISSTANSIRIDGYLGAYVVEVTDQYGPADGYHVVLYSHTTSCESTASLSVDLSAASSVAPMRAVWGTSR